MVTTRPVPLRLGPAVPEWWTIADLLHAVPPAAIAAFSLVHGPTHAPTGLLSTARALAAAPSSRRRWRVRHLAIPLDDVAIVGERVDGPTAHELLSRSAAPLALVATDGAWSEVLVPEELLDVYRLRAPAILAAA